MTASRNRDRGGRWQTIALPNEHGGWSFVGEPILLGLLLAPTWGGVALATAAVAAFLLRHPLRIVLRAREVSPRVRAARRFIVAYGVLLAAAAVVAAVLAPSLGVLIPIGLSAPLLLVQLGYDARGRSRDAMAELAGAAATGAFAAGMVLFAGWSLALALGVWSALAMKGLATVLYVRARLRLQRDAPVSRSLPVIAHVVGALVLWVETIGGVTPWTAPVGMGLLTLRAMAGLSRTSGRRPAKVVGLQELAFGVGYVLLVALGYRVG